MLDRVRQLFRWIMVTLVGGGLLAVSGTIAYGAEFVVRDAGTTLDNKVYYLDASIEYTFSDEVLEVLHKGVPVLVKLEIEIYRARDYLWDESITGLKQRYELEYHPLAKQYTIRNLNSGSFHTYPSLHNALSVLGTVKDLPILDQNLLEAGEQYTGRVRAKVDINVLPVPLRLTAYFSSAWDLTSEWFTWSFSN